MGRNRYSAGEIVQLVWGVALTLMGVAFFIRIPEIMQQVEEMDYIASVRLFLGFAFYLMVVILLSGGIKKIYRFIQIRDKAD